MAGELERLKQGASDLMLERLASPLMFSFALAWCGWNYKTLLVLLSENTVTVKLGLLTQLVYPDWRYSLGLGLLAPLAVACLYVFAYPVVERRIYKYLLTQRVARDAIRRSFVEGPLLSQRESDAMRKEIDAAMDAADSAKKEVARIKSAAETHVAMAKAQQANAENSHRNVEVQLSQLCHRIALGLFPNPTAGIDATAPSLVITVPAERVLLALAVNNHVDGIDCGAPNDYGVSNSDFIVATRELKRVGIAESFQVAGKERIRFRLPV